MPTPTIVSGGQTGVDRAALDVAMALGLPVGGWCPAGRAAEDGPIDPRYPLRETPSEDPAQRTLWNVRDSDGTLLVRSAAHSPGSAYTVDCARRLGRPVHRCDVHRESDTSDFLHWTTRCRVMTLNVAGPRESEAPGIYRDATTLLRLLLRSWLGR
jgi:hypothetical protein